MSLYSLFLTSNNGLWHWSISGIIIGLIVPALLIIGNKPFGISSSLRHICSIAIPTNLSFFKYDLKPHYWSLFFTGGIIIGGAISHILGSPKTLDLGPKTLLFLNDNNLGIPTSLYPTEIFNFQNSKGIILMVIGGFLVGFGTRWAKGCTSGHSIFGMANLHKSSIIATISFFVGGLLMTHFIIHLFI